MSIEREEFESLLRRGTVEFVFEKANGEAREAIGTLHPSKLPLRDEDPERDRKAAEKREANPDLVTYWDEEAGAFRSLHLCKLLELPVLVDEL